MSIALMTMLSPSDFGLMAIAVSIVAIGNSMSAMGVEAALISHKKDIHYLLNSAWTMELVRGVILFCIFYFISESLSRLYEIEQLSNMLKVLSLIFILNSLKNIGVVYLRKELNFKGIFIYEVLQIFTLVVVTLIVVYLTKSVWGLVAGYISGTLALVIATYLVHPYRPNLDLSLEKFKILFGYSKWILLSGQFNSIIEHGVTLLVGGVFGIHVTGQYERADMLTRKTGIQIGEMVWKVGLPVLSKCSSDALVLYKTYLSMLRLVAIVIFPLMTIFSIVAPDFIAIVLGPEWNGLVLLIGKLCLLSIMTMLLLPASILFQAIGLPVITFKISLVRISILLLTLYPLIILYEVSGVIYSLLISVLVVYPVVIISINKFIGMTYIVQLKAILPSIISSLTLFYIIPNPISDDAFSLFINIFYLLILYLITLLFLSKYTREFVQNIVVKKMSGIK